MACERLCALMTRPIIFSTSKAIRTIVQNLVVKRKRESHPTISKPIHPKTNEFRRSFHSRRDKDISYIPFSTFLRRRGVLTSLSCLEGAFGAVVRPTDVESWDSVQITTKFM
jgi:hypothetical protein